MIVRIPSPLRSYTAQKGEVNAGGATVRAVLEHLDETHPGIKFRMIDEQERIRQHIKIYVNSEQVKDLNTRLKTDDVVHIICALSGG